MASLCPIVRLPLHEVVVIQCKSAPHEAIDPKYHKDISMTPCSIITKTRQKVSRSGDCLQLDIRPQLNAFTSPLQPQEIVLHPVPRPKYALTPIPIRARGDRTRSNSTQLRKATLW
jgi:hypothetical protein